jgi:hypothetical protein
MLPDFPKQKALVREAIIRQVRLELRARNPLSASIRRHRHHEGSGFAVSEVSEDEGSDYIEISSEINLDLRAVPEMTGAEVQSLLSSWIDELAAKEAQHLFKAIDEATERAGTAVSMSGQPLSPEIMLELLRRMQVDFDENGQAQLQFVIHPSMAERLSAIEKLMEANPIYRRQWDEIIYQKREEYRVREASRKLVD